uniref:Uncharacterized protein n=1 Tax=Setaria viridis TaxID=4556 RepID=A0A4U6TJT7_SETVI|nr:hypothetical protein SEVIR_8G260166v2 [Setaria viridis]
MDGQDVVYVKQHESSALSPSEIKARRPALHRGLQCGNFKMTTAVEFSR